MNTLSEHSEVLAESFNLEVKKRSDRLMDFFLPCYFILGLLLATFYDTWLIAVGIGGLALLAYYSVKLFLPGSAMYQYVLSASLGIFMAQYIYQMHGLFEMHFFAFIGSALLITYQKWKLQIPILIVVFIHHGIFSYLQDVGFDKIYFTQLDYFDLQTFTIHILLTIVIIFISGLWAFQLKKYNEIYILQTLQMHKLQNEANLSTERTKNAYALDKLNQSLQLQAKELARSNIELEQFAYSASHDLQEPLRMVTSFLTQLENKYAKSIDNRGKQYIHFAVDGAQRMRQIILDILEFSRVGRTEDKLEQVNIQDLVTDITVLFRKQIQESQAKIIFNNLPTLQTFKAPMRQIFQNLIGNGLKYQRAGVMPVINISFTEVGKQLQFSVNDNGIGISKQYFDKIFVIFQRLHSKDTYPGTGVGLAVTRKIIENMGGRIWVESEEGKGSTFNFTLPSQ